VPGLHFGLVQCVSRTLRTATVGRGYGGGHSPPYSLNYGGLTSGRGIHRTAVTVGGGLR